MDCLDRGRFLCTASDHDTLIRFSVELIYENVKYLCEVTKTGPTSYGIRINGVRFAVPNMCSFWYFVAFYDRLYLNKRHTNKHQVHDLIVSFLKESFSILFRSLLR